MKPLNEEITLQSAFSECRSELGIQQSKRDQIIAFYLTLCGIVCSLAFLEGIDSQYRHFIFMPLAIIGFLLTGVVLRYRLYKENYWLSCKVILSLYSVEKSEITVDKVKSSLYLIMRGEYKALIDKKKGKFSLARLFFFNVKKQSTSAEKLLYTLMSLLSSGCLGVWLGMLLIDANSILQLTLAIGLGVAAFILCLFFYDFLLSRHYYHVVSANGKTRQEAVDKAYSKTWMLKMFEVTENIPQSDSEQNKNQSE